MATYIVLGQFTDQGIKNVTDTIKRAEALKEMGQKAGATIKEVYWTVGHYDIATIVEAHFPSRRRVVSTCRRSFDDETLHSSVCFSRQRRGQRVRRYDRQKSRSFERNVDVRAQRTRIECEVLRLG